MIQVAVIDDDRQERESLLSCLRRYEQETGVSLAITEFSQGEAFLEGYRPQYDVVFLDICMDGMNGLRVAKKLRELDEEVFLIFVTNMANMAIKGYRYDALDYFVKPVNYYDLKMRMERVRKSRKDDTPSLFVPYNGAKKLLNLKDICYIEVNGHQLVYHLHETSYETRGKTIARLEEELAGYGFFRCNSCYLVNLRYCKEIVNHMVSVGSNQISISRSRYKPFLDALARYAVGEKGEKE